MNSIREVFLGPEPVQWAGSLLASDVEFRLALEDGVSEQKLETAAEKSTSKSEFRERVLNAYYEQS